MLSSLSAGLLLGMSAGLAPGPLLTLVIAQTLRHSAREGTRIALAPLITDPPIVAVSVFVLSELSGFEKIIGAASLAGVVYVFYLAYGSLLAGPLGPEASQSQPRSIRCSPCCALWRDLTEPCNGTEPPACAGFGHVRLSFGRFSPRG